MSAVALIRTSHSLSSPLESGGGSDAQRIESKRWNPSAIDARGEQPEKSKVPKPESAQSTRKRPRESDEEDYGIVLDTEETEEAVSAKLIAGRRASGKRQKAIAEPGQHEKTIRLFRGSEEGVHVYEALFTKVCAQLVRTRYCIQML